MVNSTDVVTDDLDGQGPSVMPCQLPAKKKRNLYFESSGEKGCLLWPYALSYSQAPQKSHLKHCEMKENVPLVEAGNRLNDPPASKKARSMSKKFLVKKLTEHAFLPKRGSTGAAGYDLARCFSARIMSGLQ